MSAHFADPPTNPNLPTQQAVATHPSELVDRRQSGAARLDNIRRELVAAGRDLAGVVEMAHHSVLLALVHVDDARGQIATDEALASLTRDAERGDRG